MRWRVGGSQPSSEETTEQPASATAAGACTSSATGRTPDAPPPGPREPGEGRLRLVALTLAYAGRTDGTLGDLIPQAVWDALRDEGLICTIHDVTGKGMTWTTEAGFEALREIVEEVSRGASSSRPSPTRDEGRAKRWR